MPRQGLGRQSNKIMKNSTDNPFTNPGILHHELAADIAQTEAWQAEQSPTDALLVTNGLAAAVEQKQQEFGSLTGEQYDFVRGVKEQLVESVTAAKNFLDVLAQNTTDRPAGTTPDISMGAAAELLDDKVANWYETGSLVWAMEYVERLGGEMQLILVPRTELLDEDHEYIARAIRDTSDFGNSLDDNVGLFTWSDDWKFKLVPTVLDPTLDGTYSEQLTFIAEKNEVGVNLEPPTTLDALVYDYTLLMKRNRQDVPNDAFYMRCIGNLPVNRGGVVGHVQPVFSIDTSGQFDYFMLDAVESQKSMPYRPVLG